MDKVLVRIFETPEEPLWLRSMCKRRWPSKAQVCRPVQREGRRYRALNPLGEADAQLLAIVMDVSGRILRAWMPAIHAGVTEAADGKNPVEHWRWRRTMYLFSCSVGERKLMKHFVVSASSQETRKP